MGEGTNRPQRIVRKATPRPARQKRARGTPHGCQRPDRPTTDATAAENEESMARTKMNQRSASRVDVPMGATGGRTPPSKLTIALLGASTIAALWALAMLLPPGRVAYAYFFAYSE